MATKTHTHQGLEETIRRNQQDRREREERRQQHNAEVVQRFRSTTQPPYRRGA